MRREALLRIRLIGTIFVPFEKSVAKVSLWQFLQNQVDAVITVCYNQLGKSKVIFK